MPVVTYYIDIPSDTLKAYQYVTVAADVMLIKRLCYW